MADQKKNGSHGRQNIVSKRRIRKMFQNVAKHGKQITKEQFKRSLQLKSEFFSDRLFSVFDQDQSGTIEIDEFVDVVHDLQTSTPEVKVKLLFDICDFTKDNSIDADELFNVMKACSDESNLDLSDHEISCLVTSIFYECDTDNDQKISFEELSSQIEKYSGLAEGLSKSLSSLFMPKKKPSIFEGVIFFFRSKCSYSYLRNRFMYLLVTWLIIAAFILTFGVTWCQLPTTEVIQRSAISSGKCISLGTCLTIVLVLRRSASLLRDKFRVPLPSWHSLNQLHQVVALLLFAFSIVHFACCFIYIGKKALELHSESAISGLMLFLLLLVIVFGAQQFVRKKGVLKVFFWTHATVVLYIALLFWHYPKIWHWLIVPLVLYAIEFLYRAYKTVRNVAFVTSAVILPSKVVKLQINKPSHFKHFGGDYVYMNIPAISKYEWHPFTISSAPSTLRTPSGATAITVHIRSVGSWTGKLHDFVLETFEECKQQQRLVQEQFTRYERRGHCGVEIKNSKFSSTKTVTFCDGTPRLKYLSDLPFASENVMHINEEVKVYMDGPYGRSCGEILKSEHAVLIATGIGITPYASVLHIAMEHYRNMKKKVLTPSHSGQTVNLNKLDLIWVSRDHKSMEWFLNLLADMEGEQASMEKNSESRFIETQVYLTSVLERNDIKAVIMRLALDLMYKQTHSDIVTGLQARSHAGRPDWPKVFESLKSQGKGKISVFYCGSPHLADILQSHCHVHGFNFQKETI